MEMTQATCVLAACENQVFWEYDEHSLAHHMQPVGMVKPTSQWGMTATSVAENLHDDNAGYLDSNLDVTFFSCDYLNLVSPSGNQVLPNDILQ